MNIDNFVVYPKKHHLCVRFFDGEKCMAEVNMTKERALALGLELRNLAQEE